MLPIKMLNLVNIKVEGIKIPSIFIFTKLNINRN